MGLSDESNVTARPRPESEATICVGNLGCFFGFFFNKKAFSNHITNTFCNILSLSAEDLKYFYLLFVTRNEISKRKLFKNRLGDSFTETEPPNWIKESDFCMQGLSRSML